MIILFQITIATLRGFYLLILLISMSVNAYAQEPCLTLAREQHNNGNYNAAIKVLIGCPDEVTTPLYYELLASAYLLSGDLKNANNSIMLIADSVSSSSIIALKARITFTRGDYNSAYRYYKELYEADTLNANYTRHLAACADKLDSTILAISYFRKALELNPNDLISGIRLVQIYDNMDELSAADSISKKLLDVDSIPELLRLRGDVLYRMKEYSEAYKCFEPLLTSGTSNPDILRKGGVCKFINGETELAITMLSASHLIQPEHEITCYYLGMAYHSFGDFKSSELYFNAAIKAGISPNMSNYYHRMADMYETAGEYTKALESFQSALKYRENTDNFRPELYGEIGRIYEVYFNDYKNAIRSYDIFLTTYPDTTGYKYKSIKTRREQLESIVK